MNRERLSNSLSEGGLAVAAAEMAFAGGIGADITKLGDTSLPDEVFLFSESTTRFLVEVRPDKMTAFRACLGHDIPLSQLGQTSKEPRLRMAGANGEWLIWAQLSELKESWQQPLRSPGCRPDPHKLSVSRSS